MTEISVSAVRNLPRGNGRGDLSFKSARGYKRAAGGPPSTNASMSNSIPPGDIATQPNAKVVFNAPYDDKHTYHIKVYTVLSFYSAYRRLLELVYPDLPYS